MFELGTFPHPEELGLLDEVELTEVLAAATTIERLAQTYRLALTKMLYSRTNAPPRAPRAAFQRPPRRRGDENRESGVGVIDAGRAARCAVRGRGRGSHPRQPRPRACATSRRG
jgi:hypothetical protein